MLRRSGFRDLSIRLSCLLACLAIAGCAINRPSFEIDSNARTPFFGFELAPKKAPDSTYHSIRQSGDAEKQPQLLATNNPEPQHEKSKWTKWLNPLSKPKRIPLPATEADLGDAADVEPQDALDYGF